MVITQEYKRICNSCGKVWHSLKSREDSLRSTTSFYNCSQAIIGGMQMGSGATSSGSTGLGTQGTQAGRNAQAADSELASLKKCPHCGSSNYKEEINSFER